VETEGDAENGNMFSRLLAQKVLLLFFFTL